MLHSGKGLSLCGLHQATAKRSGTNRGMGSALSWEKGRTHGKKGSTGAEKYPNILCKAGWEYKKFRGAGLTSEMGWWATTMSSGPCTVPQPLWATGKGPGSKQRHQPSAFLGPEIYSFCFSRKFRGFGIHKVLLLGWELTHSTKHIYLIIFYACDAVPKILTK